MGRSVFISRREGRYPARDEADHVERSAFQLVAFEAQYRVRRLGLKPNTVVPGWDEHFVGQAMPEIPTPEGLPANKRSLFQRWSIAKEFNYSIVDSEGKTIKLKRVSEATLRKRYRTGLISDLPRKSRRA